MRTRLQFAIIIVLLCSQQTLSSEPVADASATVAFQQVPGKNSN